MGKICKRKRRFAVAACVLACCTWLLPQTVIQKTAWQETVYAAGQVASYQDVYDEQEILNRIYAAKMKYPEGMRWTGSDRVSATYVNYNGRKSQNITNGGWYGFVLAIEKEIFGTDTFEVEEYPWTGNLARLKAGDHIRFEGHGQIHSAVVLTVDRTNETVTICEGNYNNKVHWERVISKKDLDKYTGYIGSYYTKQTVRTDNTVKQQEDKSVMYEQEENKNGLFPEADGSWSYYINNQMMTEFHGFVTNEYGWWYVENGKVNFEKNDVIANAYGWWRVYGGKIDFSYCGFAANTYGWWRIENGCVDFSFNGLGYDPTVGWWYAQDGKIDFSKNGLIPNTYGWWKITNGTVDFSYNGFTPNEYGWWVIANGQVQFDYTGLYSDPTVGWWYAKDGQIDFTYTGLVENAYGWWYVRNGAIDFTYNGQADNVYGTWNVRDGHVIF